jgi:acyl dehydratase
LSLLPFMVSSSLRIDGPRFVVNYGISRVRFPGPVKAGSRIRARVKLAEFKPITGGAQLEWLVNVEREAEVKLACIAGLLVRCYN